MKRLALALFLLVPVGCKKDEPTQAKTAAADPAFDQQWSSLTKQGGAEPVYIEGELHGNGLMGEVRRAVDPIGNGSPLAAEALKGELPDSEAVKVIKANLPAVKACYAVEERNGTVGSGKAIVSLEIDNSGSVKEVKVDAPAFSASGLPGCVGNRARAWTFPKFTQGPKKFSYPFVFVGG
jgi:hypothetical protein